MVKFGILSNITNSETSSKEEVELFKNINQNAGKNVIEGKVKFPSNFLYSFSKCF